TEHLHRFVGDQRASAQLMATVARAVHHAHQHGVLHRGLKPENILLDTQGQPHVTDFGLTQAGSAVGTLPYLSPEQARGQSGLTPATDIYSLGAILYELLTGQTPFRGDEIREVLRRITDEDPKSPRLRNRALPRELEIVSLKCLAKEPH